MEVILGKIYLVDVQTRTSFKDEINQIEILTKPDENPINFLQASFGPNLPGLPMDYLQKDVVIANPLMLAQLYPTLQL